MFARGVTMEPHPLPAGSLLDALERRRREGRPVGIGLVGAGQMGTDILVQVAHMPGIEVVAAADAVPEVVLQACKVAGNGPRAPRVVDGAAGVSQAVAQGSL